MRKFIIRTEQDRERAAQIVRDFPVKKPVELVLKLYQKSKTAEQLGLLWGLWYPAIQKHIMESTGQWYSDEEIHDWMTKKFLSSRVLEINGEAMQVKKGLSKANRTETADYMTQLDQYCAGELGLILPHPEDRYYGESR